MTRFHVLLMAAGLLFVASEASSAAKRMGHNSAAKPQSHAAQSGVSASGPYNLGSYPYRRDDPYAPGVNWPGHW